MESKNNKELINRKEAILRIDPNILDTLLHPTLDKKVEKKTYLLLFFKNILF